MHEHTQPPSDPVAAIALLDEPKRRRLYEYVTARHEPVGRDEAAAELGIGRELAAFHLERGRRLYEAENDNEAVAELRRAVYLSPYQPEAHLLLGRIYLRSGRTRDAIDALKISLWSAEQAETHLVLAEAYVQAHDPAAARRHLSTVLEQTPQNEAAIRLKQKLDSVP